MKNETELLTVQEFAELARVSVQSVYKRLNNSLNPYVEQVDGRKMLKKSALFEVYGIKVEQPIQPNIQPELNENNSQSEVIFLRKQVEELQKELERERQHNREKDQQLLETLSKLAESQTALIVGQTAEKQKQLAETLIEGTQHIDNSVDLNQQPKQVIEKKSWWSSLWERIK